MNVFDMYTLGLGNVFRWEVLLMLLLGVLFGLIIGVLPGLSVTMGIAVLTPITFSMDFYSAMAMLLGCYAAGSFGGSITAIVANIPGTNGAIMTTVDGYPMGKNGLAGKAIGIAAIASFVGGFISCIVLSLTSGTIAKFAMDFSAQEYFAVGVFGLSIIAFLSQGSMIKALISGVFGVLLATVGGDAITGSYRFTFGSMQLMDGVPLFPVLIGCFGVAEILRTVSKKPGEIQMVTHVDKVLPTRKEFTHVLPTIASGSVIGTIIGAIPAAGGTIAAVISYGVNKRFSRNPEKWGHGEPRGVAAPEAANNGACGGALIPLLTLGVPGDAVTAILMSSLLFHGVTPGPMLFTTKPAAVSSIFILMFLSNFLFVAIGIAAAKPICKAIRTPVKYLIPIIALLCCVGTFCIKNSTFHLVFLIAAGVVGFLFSKGGIPVTPMILGMVLGNLIETNFRKTLLITKGRFFTIFTRPISSIFMILTILLLFMPGIISLIRKARGKKASTTTQENDFDNEVQ